MKPGLRGEVHPNDCLQESSVDDLWLMAAIAAVAEFPDVPQRAIPTRRGGWVGDSLKPTRGASHSFCVFASP